MTNFARVLPSESVAKIAENGYTAAMVTMKTVACPVKSLYAPPGTGEDAVIRTVTCSMPPKGQGSIGSILHSRRTSKHGRIDGVKDGEEGAEEDVRVECGKGT